MEKSLKVCVALKVAREDEIVVTIYAENSYLLIPNGMEINSK